MSQGGQHCPSRGAWAGAHLPTLFHHRLVHDAKRPVANDVLVLKDPLQRIVSPA